MKRIYLIMSYHKTLPNWARSLPFGCELNYVKMMYVLKCLEDNKWNRTHTAEQMDCSLRSVRKYIIELKKMGYRIEEKK